MTDAYVYPGSAGVLKNLFGIRDRKVLQRAEYRLAAINAPLALGYAYQARTLNETVWRGIHRRLFGDIYGWAGKFRTVALSKGVTHFAPPHVLNGWADHEVLPAFRKAVQLARTNAEFAEALAVCWGELNFLHPFREGNGRSTQIFVTAAARRHRWSIDWRKVDNLQEIEAAKAAERKVYGPYCDILGSALTPGNRGEPMEAYWPAKTVRD